MQLHHRLSLWAELTLIFLILPFGLLLPISAFVKVIFVIAAICYLLFVSVRNNLISKIQLLSFDRQTIAKDIFLRWFAFCITSTVLMWVFKPEWLFKVVIDNPLLWVSISLFYSVFSVYPQEFIYRHFFFDRYQKLIPHKILFVLVNASLFCIAHVVFENMLVLVLTFAGGIIFSLTYLHKRSLMLVSIEHSLYGVWLFTLGMGDMLAFPS